MTHDLNFSKSNNQPIKIRFIYQAVLCWLLLISWAFLGIYPNNAFAQDHQSSNLLRYQANIQLPNTVIDNQTQLVRFSSLTPTMLASISADGIQPSTKNFRIVDNHGRIMPVLLRPVITTAIKESEVSWVEIENNNPTATENLRQQLLVRLEGDNALIQIDSPNSTNPAEINTWWLTNPFFSHTKTYEATSSNDEKKSDLRLHFAPIEGQKPLHLQLFGSNDLQNWQLLEKTIVSKLNQTDVTKTGIHIELNQYPFNYRYWQLVANYPVKLYQAIAKKPQLSKNYFLTRAKFEPIDNDTNKWRLTTPTPMLITGIDFIVPEKQIWQVHLTIPAKQMSAMNKITSANSYDLPTDKLLANTQVSLNHSRLSWQPTILEELQLTAQINYTDIPVTLLTPVYELFFLAQGEAPYRLLVNEPRSLQSPNITLDEQQIKHMGMILDGHFEGLILLENPNKHQEMQKQWLLWAILFGILGLLSFLAYRLYQQTKLAANKS